MSSLPPLNKTTEDQVIQHAEVPELNTLLCGANPQIYSSRSPNQRRIFSNLSEPNEVKTARNPRFYSTEDISIPQEPQTTRSEQTSRIRQLQNARFFNKLHEDQNFTQSMKSKLDTYDRNMHSKAVIHHENYENHFYLPLQRRIKKQITSSKYNQYLTQKQRSIKSMDRDPVPINSPRKLPPIATIKFSTEGLKDPTSNYADKQKEDKRIDQLFKNANGEDITEKKVPPLDTLDYDHIYAQQHTRFYFGNDPENGNKSGRKVFEGTGKSIVGNELNYF